jgi:hypothetical protein
MTVNYVKKLENRIDKFFLIIYLVDISCPSESTHLPSNQKLTTMYYLIRTNLGTRTCINKSQTDIYANNMNISCNPSLPFPSNIQKVRSLQIKCTSASGSKSAEVYVDYITATNLNLV